MFIIQPSTEFSHPDCDKCGVIKEIYELLDDNDGWYMELCKDCWAEVYQLLKNLAETAAQ